MKTVLVIAAHPDDEALGCGGAMARHAAEGGRVHVIFTADGVGARGSRAGKAERYDMARDAAAILGAQEPHFLSLPDNRMDSVPLLDIVQKLEPLIAEIKPDIIYTHHHGDLNIDHALTQQAVMTACRPVPGSSVEAIYGFPVLSSTEWATPAPQSAFLPAHFIDITSFFDKKLDALRVYAKEMREFPHARSIEMVRTEAVRYGGYAGLEKAEAFTVYRQIKR